MVMVNDTHTRRRMNLISVDQNGERMTDQNRYFVCQTLSYCCDLEM